MNPDKVYNLHYHSKEINLMGSIFPRVSVTAVVVQHGEQAILNFGFSRLRDGDTFSRKYGKDLTTLRANEDPTLVIGFKKEYADEYFLTTAKTFADEVAFGTTLGRSLLSELKLPEKKKTVWTEEMIQAARQKALNNI